MEQQEYDVPQGHPQQPGPSGYLGSVRFFKHMILVMLALLIVVPTMLCVVLAVKNHAMGARIADLSQPQTAEPAADGDLMPVQSGGEELPGGGELPAWQELYPELYAQPAELGSMDVEKCVYLTFDDGPSVRTPEILKILDEYGVKATFFVVGKTDEQSKQWMRDIVDAGHTLGIHSYSHVYKDIYASVEDYLEDFQAIYDLILDTTGVAPQIFRFPGGSINGYNGATYRDIIGEMVRRGFVYFDWNVSSGDAAKGGVSAASITANCLGKVDSLRRAVILMHDSASRATTVEALPDVIEGYQAAGFTFAALTPEVKPVIYAYPN